MRRSRQDGQETRQRILEAACEEFSRRGFREATIAEICRRAGANLAAVNYHFRDKQSLYAEVWKHSAAEELRLYPMDGGVPPDALPEQRLRGVISSLVHRLGDENTLGYFQKLKSFELAMPTGIVTEVVRKFREPFRENLKGVIRELLGSAADDQLVERCERCVVAQCMVVRSELRAPYTPGPLRRLGPKQLESWIDHITTVSLAGIRAAAKAAGQGNRVT